MASKLSQSIATHTRVWYLIDAQHQVNGRLAVMLTALLQGKTKPIYHPAVDMGDYVVVINTRKIKLTGDKWNKKLYRHHTGYPGGFREILAKDVHKKDPCRLSHNAVTTREYCTILGEHLFQKPWCEFYDNETYIILWKAVYGMLPKNHLRKARMSRLHLFPDSDHIYENNIFKVLDGPCHVYKRLEDYTPEEISSYPKLVDVPHL